MQYFYSKKFFARDLFDAVKARLQKPASGLPAIPPHWTSLLHYGENPTAFSRSIKFRTKHGVGLSIASAPLCSRDPAIIGSLPRSSTEHAAPAAAQNAGQAAAASGSVDPRHPLFESIDLWAQHQNPAGGNVNPGEAPPKDSFSRSAAAQDQDEPLSKPSRIPTAVFSTLLSIAAAITAGIAISNTDTFKFGDGATGDRQPADALAAVSSGTATVQSDPRLALEPAFPASYKAIPEAPGSAPESRSSANKKPGAPSRASTSRQSKGSAAHASRKPRSGITADGRKKSVPSSRTVTAGTGKRTSAPVAETKLATSVQTRQSHSSAGTQYARCQQVKGLLRREKCRWDACDGKWGRHGCPAYLHNAKPELGTGQFGQASQPRAAERPHSDG